MTSLSLVAGSCGRGRGTGADSFLGNDLPAKHSVTDSLRKGKGIWGTGLRGSRTGRGDKFNAVAKLKKWKKDDYPWPDHLDPNISTGYLRYLSEFKPLTEKPKPVTLLFEKPLVDLEKKIIEVRNTADDTGLDFSYQIGALEHKYQQVNVTGDA